MSRLKTGSSKQRLLWWGLPSLVAGILAVALIIHLMPPTAKETREMLADRPSKEAIVARYEQMRQDAIDALDSELGVHGWEESEDSIKNLTSGCAGPDAGGQEVHLTFFGFTGTYDPADQLRSQEILTDITTRYGFTTTAVPDRPGGGMEISGKDAYGGSFTYGIGLHTGWIISTGCHLPAALHPNP